MTATVIVGAKTCKATFGILCLEMMNPGISVLPRLKQIEPSLEDPARQPETAVDSLESAKASTVLEVQSVSMLPHVSLTALIGLYVYVSAVGLCCQMSC